MDFIREQKLIDDGCLNICGIDEAGRGCLAGPLVAGAVILAPGKLDLFADVKDSKMLTPKKRAEVFEIIIQNARSWAVGVATSGEIDRYGLSYANKIAMKRAWKHLQITPDYILSDFMANLHFETPYELIKGGDRKIISIGAASIVAKVLRDRMMVAFARKFPEYGFEIHKGYGTALHTDNLALYGPCEIHRTSFAPVRALLF